MFIRNPFPIYFYTNPYNLMVFYLDEFNFSYLSSFKESIENRLKNFRQLPHMLNASKLLPLKKLIPLDLYPKRKFGKRKSFSNSLKFKKSLFKIIKKPLTHRINNKKVFKIKKWNSLIRNKKSSNRISRINKDSLKVSKMISLKKLLPSGINKFARADKVKQHSINRNYMLKNKSYNSDKTLPLRMTEKEYYELKSADFLFKNYFGHDIPLNIPLGYDLDYEYFDLKGIFQNMFTIDKFFYYISFPYTNAFPIPKNEQNKFVLTTKNSIFLRRFKHRLFGKILAREKRGFSKFNSQLLKFSRLAFLNVLKKKLISLYENPFTNFPHLRLVNKSKMYKLRRFNIGRRGLLEKNVHFTM